VTGSKIGSKTGSDWETGSTAGSEPDANTDSSSVTGSKIGSKTGSDCVTGSNTSAEEGAGTDGSVADGVERQLDFRGTSSKVSTDPSRTSLVGRPSTK
jgi:hypothetical protein